MLHILLINTLIIFPNILLIRHYTNFYIGWINQLNITFVGSLYNIL